MILASNSNDNVKAYFFLHSNSLFLRVYLSNTCGNINFLMSNKRIMNSSFDVVASLKLRVILSDETLYEAKKNPNYAKWIILIF